MYLNNKPESVFVLDPRKNYGRYRSIVNAIKYQTKLLKKSGRLNVENFLDEVNFLGSGVRIYGDFSVNMIINYAIKYVISRESKQEHIDECREVMGVKEISHDHYYYLEESVEELLKNDLLLFLDTFFDKKTDEEMKIEEVQVVLKETLRIVKEEINNIYDIFSSKTSCQIQYNVYKGIIDNSYKKSENKKILAHLRRAIKKANMNYIMMYEGAYIYPFLFDLLVKSFGLVLQKAFYEESLKSAKSFIELNNEFTVLRFDKESDIYYLYQDLLNVMQILPDNYTDYDDMAVILIKHFNEVLGVSYNSVATVLRQLRFEVPDQNKIFYRCPKALKNKPLEIDEDHFRELSLNVL
jgi:hypothetical protein